MKDTRQKAPAKRRTCSAEGCIRPAEYGDLCRLCHEDVSRHSNRERVEYPQRVKVLKNF